MPTSIHSQAKQLDLTGKSRSGSQAAPYVVVVGGANMDIIASTPVSVAVHDSTPGKISCAPGGVGRNIAENLARLAAPVHLLSAVGDDVFGKTLLDASRQAGVNMDSVSVLPGHRTATYLSLHGPSGDMDVAVNDMGIIEALTPEWLGQHHELLAHAAAVVVDCNLPVDCLASLLNSDIAAPLFLEAVSVTKCVRAQAWLHKVHTLKANGLEAAALTGRDIQTLDDAKLAALDLHVRGVTHVVISLGEQGVCWCDAQGQLGQRPAHAVEVVNTSGAGDALMAGLVKSYLLEYTLGRSVDYGMACAELTLECALANSPQLSSQAVQSRLTPQ
ncbi:PfkB family carbohydrate kinase [Rhodoferax aquaticus]|uniref:Carbohydrate kinase PfkB domain-containing protein n=1 Tax=Rhodoferax aquaticus TaxID=2527691 RepID=A0A515EP00_9BURK|nr:PfkB family carbohydrate kinase [Rhodoferax aquaticus]QDL54360.1 hypothetical protein EXZ61_09395 [Rhodoferax aquaticus]